MPEFLKMPIQVTPESLSLPMSEATAYGIWSQLREQIRDDQNRPMMSCAPHDPLSKSERELYEILTRRFMYESAVVSITVEDNKP